MKHACLDYRLGHIGYCAGDAIGRKNDEVSPGRLPMELD